MKKKPSYAMYQHQLDAIRHAEDQMAAGIDHVMLVSDTHAALHSKRWLAPPNELRGKTNMLQAQLRAMPQKEREKFLRNCIIIAPSFENVNSDLFERIEVHVKSAGMMTVDYDYFPPKSQDGVVENPCRETATTTDMFRMFRDRQASHAKRGRK